MRRRRRRKRAFFTLIYLHRGECKFRILFIAQVPARKTVHGTQQVLNLQCLNLSELLATQESSFPCTPKILILTLQCNVLNLRFKGDQLEKYDKADFIIFVNHVQPSKMKKYVSEQLFTGICTITRENCLIIRL